MRLLNTLILTCVVMLSGTAIELIEERVGVDPALRGVWAGFLMSTDGGKNWTRSDPPEEAARVSATRVMVTGHGSRDVTAVWIFRDQHGKIGNLLILDNGGTLVVTDASVIGVGVYLVQLIDASREGDPKELARFFFRVRK